MVQRRIALRLQYDGSAFHGAQRQAEAASVQESLEDSIEALTQRPHRTAFAGRTDAGVHALGQIAHINLPTKLSVDELLQAINGNLSQDVRIDHVEKGPSKRIEIKLANKSNIFNVPMGVYFFNNG